MNRMKSFKQFNEAKDKEVFFTFGRFNPPTTGHQKLMDKIAKVAKGKDYKIYASNSVDPKKNPLSYKDKIRFMRKMFPKHARSIMMSPKIKTAINIAVELHDMGYNKLTMVVGGDRIKEFESLLKKYNGVKARHGYYSFNSIDVVSAGERDPDATDVTGMSASKMRAAVADGDFKSFQNGLPKGYSGGAELFNALRKAMGFKKITDFREHVQLDKISDIREQYARGEIFNIGDKVYNKDNKIVTISERKPNYIVSVIGKKYWIQDLSEKKQIKTIKVGEDTIDTKSKIHYGVVEKRKVVAIGSKDEMIEYCEENGGRVWKTTKQIGDIVEGVKQDKDVKDKKGTQPAKYYGKDAKGKEMSKSTKDKRDAHFKKGAKMDDDDPDAYKPAPGDKSAKTKPSKHTKKFKQMFGEEDKNAIIDAIELDEKLITFAKKAYPKSGHALILAGGAGSGKGFVLDNLIGMEGKKFDVDELKRLVLKAPKITQKVKDQTGQDLSKFDLNRSADVSKLHDIVADELNLSNKKMAAFFASVMTKRPEDKPNVIFDVTLKDLRKLDNVTRLVQGAFYDKKNIHIVWVVNDVEVAKSQNTDPTRGRVVPVEILVNTHRGASQTMLDIVKMGPRLKKYMDGDITFAFNKIGVDSELKKSDISKKGKYIKDALYFKVKESGKPPMKHKDIEKDILKKIQKYVPKGQDWVVEAAEVKSFKEYEPFGLRGTDDLTKKYKKATPGEDIDEGEKKKSETWEKGFERRVVRTTKPEHKSKGYEWRIKGKERPEVTIKLYKKKPDFAEFKKQMKRVAGHEFGG
jgi:nicotinamide mononucleotide adenylyltransferase